MASDKQYSADKLQIYQHKLLLATEEKVNFMPNFIVPLSPLWEDVPSQDNNNTVLESRREPRTPSILFTHDYIPREKNTNIYTDLVL